MIRTRGITTFLALLLTGLASAQGETKPKTPPAKSTHRLDRLLDELAGVSAKEWQAKLGAIEAEIRKLNAEHKRLTDAAKKLTDRAAASKAKADRLRGLRGNLQSMRAHLGHAAKAQPMLVRPKAAPKSEKKASPTKTAKPKGKPAAKKAAPKKTTAKTNAKQRKLVTFADVLPVFEDQCIVCHDEGDASGGLDLSSFAAARQGGGSGTTLAPGDPDGSRLYRLVARTERPFMPKDSDAIPAEQLALIRQWIADGAANTEAQAREFIEARAATQKAAAARAAARAKNTKPLPPPTLPDALPKAQRGRVALAEVAAAPSLSALAASPRAPFVALTGHRQVILWSLPQQRVLGTLPFEYGDIEVLRFRRDGTELLAAGGEPGRRGHAVLYDVKTGAIRGRFRAERDTILAADISPNGQHIALGGPSKRIDVFDRSGQRIYRIAKAHRDWVLDLTFSPDGRHLASAGRDGAVAVFLADSGRDVHSLSGHTGAAHRVRFSPDGGTLVSAGADGTLRSWTVRDGKARGNSRVHRGAVTAISVDRKGRIASAGRDGTVQVHTLAGKNLRKTKSIGEWLYCVDFLAGGEAVVAGDFRGRMITIDLKQAKTPTRVESPATPTADGVATATSARGI